MKGLVLVAALSVADLLTFALVIPYVGIGAESNGLMAAAYVRYGIGAVAIIKTALAIVLILLVARVPGRRLAIGLAVGITGAGVTSNLVGLVKIGY